MVCLCTHSPKAHSPSGEGECFAIVGTKKCNCFKYRESDTAEALQKFDEDAAAYIKLRGMKPISEAIQ